MTTDAYRLLISESTDPWFNLAVEETIFNSLTEEKILFLWRNHNTVVIGRAQNAWKECNTKKMEADHIKLARRSSGGGAVFHDLGNTCFTFMAPKPQYDKTVSTNIILNALGSLGIDALASGRNDIVVKTADGEKKISGSAYKETPYSGFHHGTLLLSADLSKLAEYLNPDPKKLEAKGIQSVRSRVMNLNEIHPKINHEMISDAIIKAFFHFYQIEIVPEYISVDNFPNLPGFQARFDKQSSWEWNFGNAPSFTHHLNERFAWGGIDLYIEVIEGKMKNVEIYTDSLILQPVLALAETLKDQLYQHQIFELAINRIVTQYDDFSHELIELKQWLVEAIK